MRRFFALLLLLTCVSICAGVSWAAGETVTIIVRPGDPEAEIARILDVLHKQGRPIVVRTERADASPAQGGPPARNGAPPMMSAMLSGMDGQVMRRQLADEVAGVAQIPATLGDVGNAWTREQARTPTSNALKVAGVLAAAIVAALLAHAGLRRLLRRQLRCGTRFNAKLSAAATYAVIDGVALLAALAAGQGTIAALLPEDGTAQLLAVNLLDWLLAVGLYWLCGRILVSPQAPAHRLMPLPHAEWHFRMFLTYGVVGVSILFIGHFVAHVSANRLGVEALLVIAGGVVTAFKIVWFWTGRRDITAALLAFRPGGTSPGLLRRVGASLWPFALIGVAVLILATSQLSLRSPEFAELGRAAGLTQLLVFLLPAVAGGVDAALYELAARQPAHWSPVRRAVPMAARALMLSAFLIGGIFIVLRSWSGFFVDMDGRTMTAAVYTGATVAAVLVGGLTIWVFLQTIMDSYASVHRRVAVPGTDDDLAPVETRLGTVLPLVRGLILGLVVGITGLMALSYLGVNIAPLLAGAGVIGLAISFGSQALIRDIVSGIFFLADDAFRVGEYIDTGRLRGTVERITLRSAQLRHQNGQVHTIPFGQLMAVTNFSRDWSTVKFTIRLEHGTDLEKTRKVIKKVGLDLAQDPELGADFILPLKLQGISEITDNALIVRLKFTAKPVRPTWLQREATKRVYVALRAAGIAFASGTVNVRSHPEAEFAAGAVHAQETVSKIAAQ